MPVMHVVFCCVTNVFMIYDDIRCTLDYIYDSVALRSASTFITDFDNISSIYTFIPI